MQVLASFIMWPASGIIQTGLPVISYFKLNLFSSPRVWHPNACAVAKLLLVPSNVIPCIFQPVSVHSWMADLMSGSWIFALLLFCKKYPIGHFQLPFKPTSIQTSTSDALWSSSSFEFTISSPYSKGSLSKPHSRSAAFVWPSPWLNCLSLESFSGTRRHLREILAQLPHCSNWKL